MVTNMSHLLTGTGLVPTSQEAGGTVHSNALAQTAPGSMPGFDGGAMSYPVSTDSPLPVSADQADQHDVDAGGGGRMPRDPESGQFEHGSPFRQVEGISR